MQGKTGLVAGIVGVGLGSGLMFFLDPARGKRRRAVIRSQAKRTARQLERVAKAVDQTAHEFADGANGLTKRLFTWRRKALRLVA